MAVAWQRRFLCSASPDRWPVKQVTKPNFAVATEEMKAHLAAYDFVAVSLRRTGSSPAPWNRADLPFDTADVAYGKAKLSAERFQVFQLALCPFSLKSPQSLLAHPYNYLLYPRDELKLGLPSYSFSCQSSHLTSMAKEGFDFNACIYDGLSYLSRAQESAARIRMGKLTPSHIAVDSASLPTIADTVFVERVRSRILNWISSCKKIKENKNDALLSSLGKILRASEFYGDRPCTNIEVCSEHQVQLVIQMLREFSDEVVPLLVPAKSTGTQAVCVVLTSSKEDKILLESELHQTEEKETKKVRGFREVIDLISASQKPVVSYNSLTDFTFIYSKFIGPLPSTLDKFTSSLHEVFPNVVDVGHLMKTVDPERKRTNVSLAISYLNNNFSAAVDVKIPEPAEETEAGIHGHNAVMVSHLFAKLCLILNIGRSSTKSVDKVTLVRALEEHTNISNSATSESSNKNVSLWKKSSRKVSSGQLVFLWGFKTGLTAGKLKNALKDLHGVFSEEFDVRFADKSCAIVVFWKPGLAEEFLRFMNEQKDGISENGLRAASYETYEKACRSDIVDNDLGQSLTKALVGVDRIPLAEATSERRRDAVINFDDL